MVGYIIEGFSLGLTLGVTCLTTCAPIYLPYLLTGQPSTLKSLLTVLEISAGRFFSYLTFGALMGAVGQAIAGPFRDWFTVTAYILLSLYLVLTAIRTRGEHRKCHIPRLAAVSRTPFILGILTGINFCPSFLMALSRTIDIGGAVNGMGLFFGFFISSTLFLLPLVFVGEMTRFRWMKPVSVFASLLVAGWFLAKGVSELVFLFGWVDSRIHLP